MTALSLKWLRCTRKPNNNINTKCSHTNLDITVTDSAKHACLLQCQKVWTHEANLLRYTISQCFVKSGVLVIQSKCFIYMNKCIIKFIKTVVSVCSVATYFTTYSTRGYIIWLWAYTWQNVSVMSIWPLMCLVSAATKAVNDSLSGTISINGHCIEIIGAIIRLTCMMNL